MLAFKKTRLFGAELFHADRQTDRYDEFNSRFSQFIRASPWRRYSRQKILLACGCLNITADLNDKSRGKMSTNV